MLLSQHGTDVVAISQPAHAWLAGRLAAAWETSDIHASVPRHDLILATALHDIGWLEWERTPTFDRNTGFPLKFQNVPAEVHTRLWQGGVDHAAAYGAYVALLISRHGDAIYDRTFDMATARPEAARAVTAFRSVQCGYQRHAIAQLAADPTFADAVTESSLAFTEAFIVALDTISLNLCWGLTREVAIRDVPRPSGEMTTISLSPGLNGAIVVRPWPFIDPALHVSVEGRRLEGRSRDQAELDRRLAEASAIVCRFDLVQA